MPQYQGIWNLAQQAQALTRQQWVTDPLFNSTVLLLQADNAANSAQNNSFLDSSNNSFAITRNGNTTQGSFSPFAQGPGYWGNYFDGSSLLTVPANNAFVFGTGDFTIEFWIYQTVAWNINNLINNVSSGNTSWAVEVNAGNIYLSGWNTTFLNAGAAPSINAWHHIAVCRSGTTLSMFIDGVRIGTTTNSTDFSANNTLSIGGFSGFYYANGYLSNVRLVKGTAVYNPSLSTCAVPTSPLTAISGTSVLTCQNNRFLDNSSNAFAVSVGGGTPSVQAFSPFAPQYQYTPTVTGGSGYFDGTGDYLYAGNNAAFTMGTGDFTYECWVYHTSITGQQTYFARTSGNFNGVYFYKDSSGFPGVYYTGQIATSSVAITANQWYHLVASRLSGTLRIFVNGVQTASVANTTNLTESVCYVGGDSNATNPMIGYMTGCRIQKGTGVSSVTVPTAPISSTATTSLLLNFTNAGILDGTMKNNLETVGNVQVSTNVVKYGSGSIYLDGTGDWLQIPDSELFNLRGDFTIEFWMNPTSSAPATTGRIYSHQQASVGAFLIAQQSTTGFIRNTVTNSAGTQLLQQDTTVAPPAGVWTHIAYVRFGNVFTFYINGVANISTTAAITISNVAIPVTIGANITSTPTGFYNGYLDDYRVTQGIARYTRNFTPPQVALPRQ